MLPGPERVISCPYCQVLVRHTTILGDNPVGARIWTDGKQESPLAQEPPQVIVCVRCNDPYWTNDAKKVGELSPSSEEFDLDDTDPAWANAPLAEEPTEAQYYAAISGGLARDKVEERTLRVFAWWRGNDEHREDSLTDSLQTATGSRRSNLEALVHLLDGEEIGELLMKAEALRQLGEFDAARRLLAELPKGELDPIVEQLRILCDARDVCVRELLLVE